MDLNYLFARHQISLMKAASTLCLETRTAHLGLAGLYVERIDRLRSAMRGAGRSVFL
ncbi:MAG: hypothetical protein ACOY5R_12610 [Pseudomonadota bacterium]|uniref:hypothetical protein n=1 Tax=Rhizorhabdus phycosphaerae TaxID=2711156 RepID=UPI0013EAA6B2|nr:hypothetical protein [Rhizorhabdus phycosphaerae]